MSEFLHKYNVSILYCDICCHLLIDIAATFMVLASKKMYSLFTKLHFRVVRHHSLWIETTGPKIEILILYWCSHDMRKQKVHILFKITIFTRITPRYLKNILRPPLKVKRFSTYINKLGGSSPRSPVLGPKCRSPGARLQSWNFNSATLILNSFLRFCHFLFEFSFILLFHFLYNFLHVV